MNYQTVRDIPNSEEWELITNSQDVNSILAMYGFPATQRELSLFVHVGEGEYLTVLAFEGSIPEFGKDLYYIHDQFVDSHLEAWLPTYFREEDCREAKRGILATLKAEGTWLLREKTWGEIAELWNQNREFYAKEYEQQSGEDESDE